MAHWSYVFTDIASGRERATFPMVGVDFEQKFLDVGTLEGTIPTTDPAVRALDPWSTVQERRTAVYVECDDVPVWGGIVWGVEKSQDVYGLKIHAATWESWLNFALLQGDVNLIGAALGAPSTVRVLVNTVQGYTGANVGLQVVSPTWPGGVGGDGTGEMRVAGQVYKASDLKALTDVLVNWAKVWGNPIEWRVDTAKLAGGGYVNTLLVTESTLDMNRNPLLLRHGVSGANLLTFTDSADGTQRPTAIYGSMTGKSDSGVDTTLFDVTTADGVGDPEIAAGFPLLAVGLSVPCAQGVSPKVAAIDEAINAEQLDRLAQGYTLSNLTVRADTPALSSYVVGDPVQLEITHPAYAEWPAPAVMDDFRLVGRKVTPGTGSTPDAVELTVVPGGDRIPNSRTLSAQLKLMASRIRMMETKAGL